MGMGSLTTAALTFGAEFDLRNVLEGKWPSSSVSIALAAILLYGSQQRQHLQARKGLFRSSASARARLPVCLFACHKIRELGTPTRTLIVLIAQVTNKKLVVSTILARFYDLNLRSFFL